MFSILLIFFGLSSQVEAQGNHSLRPTNTLLEETTYFNSPLFAGGYDGVGGGDLVDIRKLTAWFYGTEEIKTCFHVTQNFGLEHSKIKELIEKSISDWQNFFNQREINSHFNTPINTNFVLADSCGFNDDLVFYFGTGPISYNLNDFRAYQLYIKPVAYVNKTDMSEDFIWSRGYIKFVEPHLYLNHQGKLYPDWSNEEDTFQMISHELGHVLGFLHVSDSLMSSQIAQNLFATENKEQHNSSMSQLFPSLESKSYLTPSGLTDSLWSQISSIQINTKTGDFFIDSQRVNKTYEITDDVTPLLVNFHQSEPLVFKKSRVMFFSIDGRHFFLETKKNSIEIRENGLLVLEATLEEN